MTLLFLACVATPEKTGSTSNGDADADTDTDTDTDADTDADADADTGPETWTGRPWPSTRDRIGIFADQLPGGLTPEQQQFVVDHFDGTEKQTLSLSEPLRELDPDFLVIHYHLAIWQSAPDVSFIVDGNNWSNDYDTVSANENWFWHNEDGARVASIVDGKELMNLHDDDFTAYWRQSLIEQVHAGDYDGIFFDSAGPDLLQWEAQDPPEPRLQGTGARDTPIDEWDGQTYIDEWNAWIAGMNEALADEGIPLIPNTGSLTTTWDTSDYSQTEGMFVEGFASSGWSEEDWLDSMNDVLSFSRAGHIVIAENYLDDTYDLVHRRFYLGCYLLVKGDHTYLDAFASSPLEWYPEWEVETGEPEPLAASMDDLRDEHGLYVRHYAGFTVYVNPTAYALSAGALPAGSKVLTLAGGGVVGEDGNAGGTATWEDATSLTVGDYDATLVKEP